MGWPPALTPQQQAEARKKRFSSSDVYRVLATSNQYSVNRILSVSCTDPIYLENDGRLEHAQQMAGHESPRTTKLYDRTKDEITLSEVDRIRL
jgi:hypothetical protein